MSARDFFSTLDKTSAFFFLPRRRSSYISHDEGKSHDTIAKMFGRVVVLGLLLTVALTSGEILNRGWWSHTVFYQVYPRSFMDADDDGVGDLKGKGKRTVKTPLHVGRVSLTPSLSCLRSRLVFPAVK